MSLTGIVFLSLVGAATVAAFVGTVVAWPRLGDRSPGAVAGRAGTLLLVNVLVVLAAGTQLNAHYLFFTDWHDLVGSVTPVKPLTRGGSAQAASQVVPDDGGRSPITVPPLSPSLIGPDRVLTLTVHGRLSGVTGTVLVQIPPGYQDGDQARRYPVLETFAGYPGSPAQWIRVVDVGADIDQAVAQGRIGPVLVVSPELEIPPGTDTECVDGAGADPHMETWLTQDVPSWVEHTFRTDQARSSWATIGLSAGGWCAAMATMLHPRQYSAAIVLGGYFRPDFSPGQDLLLADSPAAERYDLVRLAAQRPPPVAVWLQTSHRDPLSYGPSEAFLHAARPPLSATATVLTQAGHRMSVWQAQVPPALAWLGHDIPGFAPV